jgi:hypothetical protein
MLSDVLGFRSVALRISACRTVTQLAPKLPLALLQVKHLTMTNFKGPVNPHWISRPLLESVLNFKAAVQSPLNSKAPIGIPIELQGPY